MHKFFIGKFASTSATSGNLRSCESVIMNFMYSLEAYKLECPHCLLFASLLADLYGFNVLLFICDLRQIIQEDCGYKILEQLEKKNGIEHVQIPYAKIKNVAGRFISRNKVSEGVEVFMDKLRETHPSVGLLSIGAYRVQHRTR